MMSHIGRSWSKRITVRLVPKIALRYSWPCCDNNFFQAGDPHIVDDIFYLWCLRKNSWLFWKNTWPWKQLRILPHALLTPVLFDKTNKIQFFVCNHIKSKRQEITMICSQSWPNLIEHVCPVATHGQLPSMIKTPPYHLGYKFYIVWEKYVYI